MRCYSIRLGAMQKVRQISLLIEGMKLHGCLKDSLAAREFAKRLPLTVTCKKNEAEYYSSSANGIFDPSDIQLGFKAGDLMQWGGWFSIAYKDVDDKNKEQRTMVIGHVEDITGLWGLSETVKIVLKDQED